MPRIQRPNPILDGPLGRVSLLSLCLAGALFAPAAQAQQAQVDAVSGAAGAAPDVPDLAVAEPKRTPEVRVVTFVDNDTNDCDPAVARYGLCIERVEFDDPDPISGSKLEVRVQKKRWKNIGSLYARGWEDLAYRWRSSDDVLSGSLIADGFNSIEESPVAWGPYAHTRGVWAMPDGEVWVTSDGWVGDRPEASSTAKGPYYPRIRYKRDGNELVSLTVREPPEYVVVDGRFARRLTSERQAHDYDIMEGDPSNSGPFFEMMYPNKIRGQGGQGWFDQSLPSYIFPPLNTSDAIRARLDLVDLRPLVGAAMAGGVKDYEDSREAAASEFLAFARLLKLQVSQYAMEYFTPNQLRALTALTSMEYPPDPNTKRSGKIDGNNPGGVGETDDPDTARARMSRTSYGTSRKLQINYEEIDRDLVERYLEILLAETNPGPEFYQEVSIRIKEGMPDLIREGSPQIPLEKKALEDWLLKNTNSGAATRRAIEDRIRRMALSLLIEAKDRPDQDRARIQTSLLLDQLSNDLGATVRQTVGRVSPRDLVNKTTKRWQTTLAEHGRFTEKLPEDTIDLVDPNAVCGLSVGTDALDETSYGAIDLDIIIAEQDGLEPEALLWKARHDMPFFMVDNPYETLPQVTRLVGLPADQALYRVRWTIWTGWHMLWSITDGTPESTRSLAMRTAAICDDMVLAPPDLVATLVRAGLLEDDLFPTTAPLKAKGLQRYATWPGPFGRIARGMMARRDLDSHERVDQEVEAYLQRLVRDPLRASAAEGDGAMLVVFDTASISPYRRMRNWRPRTPYSRTQSRAGWLKWQRTAAWFTYHPSDVKRRQVQVSPAYRATESTKTDLLRPHWNQNSTLDFNFVGGMGLVPYRLVNAHCFPVDNPNVAPCRRDPDAEIKVFSDYDEAISETAGFNFDMAGYANWWILDDPRIALEVGPMFMLDITPGWDTFWLKDSELYTGGVMATDFRPQAGVSVGIRHAPDPSPLVRPWTQDKLWGAEGPDGTSKLQRSEWGIRGAALAWPLFNGVEGTITSEVWWNFSLRNKNSPHANFTPYHPGLILGPYVRYQLGFNYDFANENVPGRALVVSNSHAVVVGARLQVRYKTEGKGGDLAIPEAK